jgi:ABC-type multidrug transport system ATPase subunit
VSKLPIVLEYFSVHLKDRLLFDIDRFVLEPGTSTVIVGTTGSGKSVLIKALSGLLYGPFTVTGNMQLHGHPAYINGKKAKNSIWSRIRRVGITFVPAETAQAMNPALSLDQNLKLIAPEARDTVVRRLKEYFSLDFARFAHQYPDEVSGGELQRITLMILLSRSVDVIFLDEPTVNLDRQLRKRFIEFLNAEILGCNGKTVLIASHDLDFVRALKLDRILRLDNQKLNEIGNLPESTVIDKDSDDRQYLPGLELNDVSQHYLVRGLFGERPSWAFKHLDIYFKRSHIYGITGPSGCGKTSMIKAILRLIDGSSGVIKLGEHNLVKLKPRETGRDPSAFRPFRRKIAVVQQDSRFSFFPDLRIRDSLTQINKVYGDGAFDSAKVEDLMDKIQLRRNLLDTLPRSLSSGEMKRMDIVRALAADPDVILLDEPFAHIDFETRALVMKAIAGYLKEKAAILIVVTHEDFDLQYFIQTNYDFLSMVKNDNPSLFQKSG